MIAVTLAEISQLTEAELIGDAKRRISGVATLHNAKEDEISFLANRRYYSHLKNTRAAAVFLIEKDKHHSPVDTLIVADPHLAWVKVVRHFHPVAALIPGVDESAVIAEDARIHPHSYIGAQVSIGANAEIGAGVYIGAGSVIGRQVTVGANSRLVAKVTLCDAVQIGKDVLLHPGVVIGADGFGIVEEQGAWLKIPQLGTVIIGDEVEVGANSTIDRGALDDTIIEHGVKIDNQVQIAHNVHIGAHTAIAGCAGVAGSASIGRRCRIGGAVSINGHIEICDDVTITGMSGVAKSIRAPGIYSGTMTTTDNRTWRKNIVRFTRLHEIAARLARLEKAVAGKEK